MIVGTAGHIDHGKTTLVKALTGVDCDRLPEEKQRGISIALGYAFMDVDRPDAKGGAEVERIGFIDVPGHERLVHTMVAGATGIDFALLLVAADDGVMPQTREHLAVLALLGLSRGAVAITKIDRVSAERVAEVRAEVQALLLATPLASVPIVAVSATRGDGIANLRQLIRDAARDTDRHGVAAAAFRLAVDRSFTLAGVGTIVTGTVHAGEVRVGDELALVPAATPRWLRVRGVHAQNQVVTVARAGQRCAIALAGIAKDEIGSGQWLVDPAVALSTQRIDVELHLWPGEAKALRSGTTVVVHLGAGAFQASVALLEGGDSLAPGGTALAQLVLHQAAGAWHGERVVLRDASASRTIAGATVLDPAAPARYRRTPQRLAELAALKLATPALRIAALIAVAPHGVDLRRFAAAQGIAIDALTLAEQALVGGDWALGAAQTRVASDAVLAALQAFHAAHPDDAGPDAARLRRLAVPRMAEPLWRALLERLRGAAQVGGSGAFVHLPEHAVALSATEKRIAQKTAATLLKAGFEGAWARDLARDCGEAEALVRTTLARLAQRGELHQVVKDLYYPPSTLVTLATVARRLAADNPPIGADRCPGAALTAAGFRDATGLGRKRAIQILEYFDRVGLLRRVGDDHRLRADSDLFKAGAA
jgi:selenocysteine-specific elongation factor